MEIRRMPIDQFVSELEAALIRKDGYIMGTTGQDPKKWPETSWFYTQYTGNKLKKALYWREHAARVWDCNGLAEGIYKDFSGQDINSKARYNYQGWCSVKGTGLIPAAQRRPGMAVFWGDDAPSIHHVAYLYKPVDADNPTGDWYLIEARGVMYGVVKTRLFTRKPNFWGAMDKYFDYGYEIEYVEPKLGERLLQNGVSGEDVKELQTWLNTLGFDCGKADGDFGKNTKKGVEAFQSAVGITIDGKFGSESFKALEAYSKAIATTPEIPHDTPSTDRKPAAAESNEPDVAGIYRVVASHGVYLRYEPGKLTSDNVVTVIKNGSLVQNRGYFTEVDDTKWLYVEYQGMVGFASGRYLRKV